MEPVETATPEKILPTVGQLMRSTAQAIQHLYRDDVGHTPSRVTCHLVKDKLLVWAENSITRPEQMLFESNSSQLSAVSLAIKSSLKEALTKTVEDKLKVKVITLLSDVSYEQNCTAMVMLLSQSPSVRPTSHRISNGRY